MAKIRLQGNRVVDVSAFEGNRIHDEWMAKKPFISLGTETVRYSAIQSVERVPLSDTEDTKRTYAVDQAVFRTISPEEKARKASWGHFSLFYWGVFNQHPDPLLLPQVQDVAIGFYRENPDRTCPTPQLWADMLGVEPHAKLNKVAYRLLRKVEEAQQDEIRALGLNVEI